MKGTLQFSWKFIIGILIIATAVMFALKIHYLIILAIDFFLFFGMTESIEERRRKQRLSEAEELGEAVQTGINKANQSSKEEKSGIGMVPIFDYEKGTVRRKKR